MLLVRAPLLLLLGWLLSLRAARAALPLPSFMTKCTTKERAALNACALDNARRAVASVATKGARKYGVLPFDPAVIPRVVVEQSGFYLELTDATIRTNPPGSWKVETVDLDLDKRRLSFVFFGPMVDVKGNFVIKGKILVLNLDGKGKCHIQFENYTVSISLDYDIDKSQKDGLEYVKLKNPILDANTTKTTYKFDNLFDGQEAISKATHDIANSNWQELFADTKESSLKAFGQYTVASLQSFFDSVPYKDVFPQ